MYVIKRNGEKESVKFDKVTRRLEKLLYDIKDIDATLITQKICNRIFPGITTTELDNLASQVCMAMVSENFNYGVLGSRIVISNHQKNTKESFLEVIKDLKNNKDVNGALSPLVSEELLNVVSENELKINNMIDYERDYLLDFFAFKTLEKSYFLKVDKKPLERPQHLFMRVAIGIHGDDLENVEKTYNNMSLKNYTHATPTLFNAGTDRNQLASCFLNVIEDSIEGIFETYTDCGLISKWAGGIGCDISKIRANGSYIRKTGGTSDGIMPLLKTFNSIARQFNQGGKRLGSFAMYIAPWHSDIFDFLDAKKNTGDENNRARDLFYALWVSDLFMKCVEKNEDWYLMCNDRCPGLVDCYGEDFENLYKKYVKEGKYNKKVKARDVWEAIISSQVEQGIPYILYKDSCNRKSNQKNLGTIRSSNLCAEIIEFSSSTETSVCNLASICLPQILEEPSTNDFISHMKWYDLLNEEEKKLFEYYKNGDLKLFSKADCEYCKLLKSLLNKFELKYEEIDANEAEMLRIKSNPSLSVVKPFETVPQLFSYIKEKDEVMHLGGYDDNWKLLRPKINYKKLLNLSYELTINLNKIIDKNFYPIEKTKVSNLRHRPIGIGVQGLADLFLKLKLPFESDESQQINKEIFETIYYGAMECSIDLAKKDGKYSTFDGSPLSQGLFQFNLWGLKDEDLSGRWNWSILRENVMKYGSRNSLLVALMPTASTSQIMGSFVEAFEALTSNLYTRRTLAGEFTVVNNYLMDDLISLDMWNENTKNRLIYDKGSVQNIKGLPKFLKDIYKTVWEIPQKNIIKMSADRGPFVCQSQSLNLFFEQPNFKSLTAAHFAGWKLGLKTGSYYIRSKPALSAQRFGFDVKKEKEFKEEDEGCLNCSA